MAKKKTGEGRKSKKVTLTLEGKLLDEINTIIERMERLARKSVSYDDCIRFLISHYTGDTYTLYIPEEYKKRKEEWEKKNRKQMNNNEFLELLIENLKI